jgi:hypothetical protein
MVTQTVSYTSGTTVTAGQLLEIRLISAGNQSDFDNVTLTVDSSNTAPATYSVGGTVSGLSGTGLVLQDNLGNNLPVSAGATRFTFSTAIVSGGTYNVTVLAQPSSPAQNCVVFSGSGTANANVASVQVTCTTVTATYTIGGTISGLSGTGLVL